MKEINTDKKEERLMFFSSSRFYRRTPRRDVAGHGLMFYPLKKIPGAPNRRSWNDCLWILLVVGGVHRGASRSNRIHGLGLAFHDGVQRIAEGAPVVAEFGGLRSGEAGGSDVTEGLYHWVGRGDIRAGRGIAG